MTAPTPGTPATTWPTGNQRLDLLDAGLCEHAKHGSALDAVLAVIDLASEQVAAREAATAEQRGAEALAVLRELVRLKDGPRDTAYERAKPKAWAAARRLLGAPGSQSVDSLITRLDNALERAETERLALCDERRQLLAETEHLRAEVAAAREEIDRQERARRMEGLCSDKHAANMSGHLRAMARESVRNRRRARSAEAEVARRTAAVAVPDTTHEGGTR